MPLNIDQFATETADKLSECAELLEDGPWWNAEKAKQIVLAAIITAQAEVLTRGQKGCDEGGYIGESVKEIRQMIGNESVLPRAYVEKMSPMLQRLNRPTQP